MNTVNFDRILDRLLGQHDAQRAWNNPKPIGARHPNEIHPGQERYKKPEVTAKPKPEVPAKVLFIGVSAAKLIFE